MILTDPELKRLAGLGGAEDAPVVGVEVRRRRPLIGPVVAVERKIRAAGAKRESRDGLVHQKAVLVPACAVAGRVEDDVLHAKTAT